MKKVLSLLLVLVMVCSFAACGEDSDTAKIQAYIDASGQDLVDGMEESFAGASGMTCKSSIKAEDSGIVITIKINEIESAAETLVSRMGQEGEAEMVDFLAEQNNVCIIVFDIKGNSAVKRYTNHTLDTCVVHSIDNQSYRSLYDSAKQNGGRMLQRFMYDAVRNRYIGISGDFFDEIPTVEEGDYPESIIYTVIGRDSHGGEYFIMLNSVISPVTATLKTLHFIIVVMTVLLLIIAAVVAFFVSRWIARPITSLTASARDMP